MRTTLRDKLPVLSLAALCVVQALLFARLHPQNTHTVKEPTYHALDVGQGDATLIELPDGTRMLTDAGPDGSVVAQVAKVLGDERYIDVGIITHPEKDHFYGFLPLLRQYRFGIILWNGRMDSGDMKDWNAFVAQLQAEHIPMLQIGAGDSIRTRSGYVAILSPGPEYLESAALNDTSVIEHVQTSRWSALLTGDIDAVLEHDLIKRYGNGLQADILKVPHHGSKYGSTEEFIDAVQPQVATISVGIRNTYGHPSPEALGRYDTFGANVFRTDQVGAVQVTGSSSGMDVTTLDAP